ncbi:hypothetical protein H6P81_013990 [Aristolochia fimbriata]|uniref:Delta(3)-Delta(2)-enoyl-CoA isomerase n=1 Tax=Aristolochia fimbriata TaxID=158543 RepID=A0AAV7EGA5_ARIFI|nr:hypothetical protein H6P81_013990 [Aristolochia fimbriata]
MCTLEKRGCVFLLTLTGDSEHRLGPSLIDSISAAIRRVRAASAPGSVLVTTAEGKFFSNGFDLNWAKSSGLTDLELEEQMGGPFERRIMAELLSLPIPTVAAVTGHAAAAGFALALCHDYVFMRKDRGFLYMSELDIGLPFPDSFMALLRDKIGDPAARRNVALRAAKVKATEAAAMGFVEGACEGAGETVAAAMRLAEELAGKKWDGGVYVGIRRGTFRETSQYFGLLKKDENKPGIILERRGKVFVLTLTGDGEHRLTPALISSIGAHLRRLRTESSGGSVLVTAAEGKFFCNGIDLSGGATREGLVRRTARAFEDQIMGPLTCLPMPTVAVLTGHAAGTGFVLALCHDYVVMRRDGGAKIYMSELDIKYPIPATYMALMRAKIADAAALRDVALRARKVKGAEAAEMGLVDAAHDGADETLAAAMGLAEELSGQKWVDGEVYAGLRKGIFREVAEVLRVAEMPVTRTSRL